MKMGTSHSYSERLCSAAGGLGEREDHNCLRALFHITRPLRVIQTDRAGDEADFVEVLPVDAFLSSSDGVLTYHQGEESIARYYVCNHLY